MRSRAALSDKQDCHLEDPGERAPFLLALMPGDIATLTILCVVFAALSARLPSRPSLWSEWVLHGALLAAFACLCAFMVRHEKSSWVPNLRALAIVVTMATLYLTLARVPFEAIPWSGDHWLERLDRALFLGVSPALWTEQHLTYGRIEFFSFMYAIYIPYLYLSILLGCVGRPPEERNIFITGMALTYALGFLGYIFVPARGPVVHLATEFSSPLDGGFFHDMVVSSIRSVGGPHGAFPSLHLGSATFACLFDLRYNRLRGLAYLPLVLLIAMATVVVRYHYVVDLIAGVIIAFVAIWTALRWQGRWEARRLAWSAARGETAT